MSVLSGPPPERFVLLRADRTLQATENPADGRFRVEPLDDISRAAARLISRRGDWWTVEISAGDHCYPAATAGGARLRLRVRPEDLGHVVKASHREKRRGGTAVQLMGGLAVEPSGEGYAILDDPFAGLPVPARAVGRVYTWRGTVHRVRDEHYMVRVGATLRIGSTAWRVPEGATGPEAVTARLVEERGERARIGIAPLPESLRRSSCLKAIVLARRADLSPARLGGGGVGWGHGRKIELPRKTTLYFGDTDVVAGTAKVFNVVSERQGSSGRRCFGLAGTLRRLTDDGETAPEVCIDPPVGP